MTFLKVKSINRTSWINLKDLQIIQILPVASIKEPDKIEGHHLILKTKECIVEDFIKDLTNEQIEELVFNIATQSVYAQNFQDLKVIEELDHLIEKVRKVDNNARKNQE